MGDLGSIPRLERSSGEGKGYPLQYSGMENSMNCTVHGVTKNRTQLNDFNFQSHPYMATGKTIALTKRTFVGKVMSLFFNTLSGLVIAFLSRSKRLLISLLQSPYAVILEPRKI